MPLRGDRIVISAKGFQADLAFNKVLDNSQFVLGTKALDANDRFIYDPSTGKLFFDPDGSGNAKQQQIAILEGKPGLNASDIFISGSSTAPSIKLISPNAGVNGEKVAIKWNAFDIDSNAKISLYYDTDNNGFDGVLIKDNLKVSMANRIEPFSAINFEPLFQRKINYSALISVDSFPLPA